MEASRERAGGGVARPTGCGNDPLVVVTVRIGERATRSAQLRLTGGLRLAQLGVKLGIGKHGEPRVTLRVRADLPAGCGHLGDLVPGAANQLVRIGSAGPLLDAPPG